MGTKNRPTVEESGVTRFRDAVPHGGHAWVLARDDKDYFYECLKCGDRVHVLTIEQMAKAQKHGYAYMPLNHRAPWNCDREQRIWDAGATKPRIVREEPYPPCTRADVSLPDVDELPEGPVVAVPRDEPGGR